jgi:hypothetical protein
VTRDRESGIIETHTNIWPVISPPLREPLTAKPGASLYSIFLVLHEIKMLINNKTAKKMLRVRKVMGGRLMGVQRDY